MSMLSRAHFETEKLTALCGLSALSKQNWRPNLRIEQFFREKITIYRFSGWTIKTHYGFVTIHF
ncbi:hypothetical protein [Maricaulis sp. MIT060901]|uniref:hypothetical protein n=1 Tax=Maricaulis sp. MIT060901 TaxID=3096993 RepID=UPI003999B65E